MYLTTDDMLAEKEESRRHRCRISLEELQSMVKYVEHTLEYTKESHPEWSYETDTPTYKYIKRLDGNAGVLRSRTLLRVPGVPPQALFDCLFNPESRLAFDKFYTRFEVSRVVEDDLDVLVSEVEAPLGVSNREFVEWRRMYLPNLSHARQYMRYVIYLRSCDDSECSPEVQPKQKKVERAEAWMSGYIMKWWFQDGQLMGSELLVISQVDNKGMLPKFLVNTVTASGPKKWASSLRDAVCKICLNKIDINSMSDEELEAHFNIRR